MLEKYLPYLMIDSALYPAAEECPDVPQGEQDMSDDALPAHPDDDYRTPNEPMTEWAQLDSVIPF